MSRQMCAATRRLKIRYSSEDLALEALEDALTKRNGRPKNEKRAYHCPTCEGWHLTALAKPPDTL